MLREGPQTTYIFQAAMLEDHIRTVLVAAEGTDAETRRALFAPVTNEVLPALHRLNDEQFGASPAICETLQALEATLRAPYDLEAIWDRFRALADRAGNGSNFGTWAI
jgi:hypothetical protein